MAEYIPKSAFVAEIEKRISRNKKRKEWEDIPEKRHQLIIEGQLLGELKHFLDSLEVKEVDLDAEWEKYFEHRGNIATVNIKHLTKHFFELGLKAQKG